MSTLLNVERNLKDCHDEDFMFNTERSLKDSHDEDLMLAAEIGKSLLERNRELELVLKATQEFAEEQCAQREFYMNQVEIHRNGKESSTRACEQLEANNQMLSDKCDQWKAEFKIVEGKSSRLWDVINTLEKRIEELTSELDMVNENLTEIKKEKYAKERSADNIATEFYNPVNNINSEAYHLENIPIIVKDIRSLSDVENEQLKKHISELNIQHQLGKLEKGELESQLEDLGSENQLLYHKISNLNQEINEWETFAQKEENYRRLATAFTIKHYTEIEPDASNLVGKPIPETLLPQQKNLIKAKSCDCLNLLHENNLGVLKSPNLVNNILSSVNSSSFLSELDTEYADLVKRYETLLEKFKKQEGKSNENPERKRKVQRAIQTLSMDFSLLTLPSPNAIIETQTSPLRDFSSSCANLNTSINNGIGDDDYRKMFSDIFAKLKESNVL